MSLAFSIFWANARKYPLRLVLTSLAMIAASCVVVWVASGYDAMMGQMDELPDKPLGDYDLLIMPSRGHVPDFMIRKLKKDSGVKGIDSFASLRVNMVKDMAGDENKDNLFAQKIPSVNGRPPFGPSLVGTTADHSAYPLLEGRWFDKSAKELEGVITDSARGRMLKVTLGDYISVIANTGEYRVKIVGIATTPPSLPRAGGMRGGPSGGRGGMGGGPRGGQSMSRGGTGTTPAKKGYTERSGGGGRFGRGGGIPTNALYVPLDVVDKVNGFPMGISYAGLKLKPAVSPESFEKQWTGRKLEGNQLVDAKSLKAAKAKQESGRMAAGARKQAYAATGLSLLAAFFIIVTTLSMGVNERVRQFAILRSVALTRKQIFMVIAFESLFLALVGWIGGLVVGYGVIKVGLIGRPGMMLRGSSGVSIGMGCILLTAGCSFISAILASLYPAWKATRVNLLASMQPLQQSSKARLSVWAVVVGLVLIFSNYFILNCFEMDDKTRVMLYGFVGCPAMCLGFLCLTPLIVFVAEGVFGRLLGLVLGINHKLLGNLLSGNMWRTLGTTVAMTVGLGLFCAIHIWGASMLVPFFPGDWTPDMLVSFLPAGIKPTDVDKMRHVSGVNPDQCIPLAVEQVKLEGDLLKSKERMSVVSQDNVVFVGLDPDKALGAGNPMLKLSSQNGDMAETVRKLKSGRYCVVPDYFLKQGELAIGDSFGIIVPNSGGKVIKYTIADAVSMPGIHWITKMTGLRRNTVRTSAMILTSFDNAKRDFQVGRIKFLWANVNAGADYHKIQDDMQKLADSEGEITYTIPNIGEMTTSKQFVNVTSSDMIRSSITNRAEGMLWMMSRIPLMILLISSFGVANTIIASVKSRKWEMGIMRATGTSGFGLARIVLAEALLIGSAACLLSLLFGVAAGFFGTSISEFSSFFGGMETPLTVPWNVILQGFGIAFGICLVASLWPAVQIGRHEVLRLLEDGRGSM